MACFHSSYLYGFWVWYIAVVCFSFFMKKFVIVFELFRIMIAALSFLLDYENIEDANSVMIVMLQAMKMTQILKCWSFVLRFVFILSIKAVIWFFVLKFSAFYVNFAIIILHCRFTLYLDKIMGRLDDYIYCFIFVITIFRWLWSIYLSYAEHIAFCSGQSHLWPSFCRIW